MKRVRVKYYLINNAVVMFFLIVCALNCKAQTTNLIPDPSFEDTLQIVDYFTQRCLKQWKNLDTNRILACRSGYMSINNLDPTLSLPSNNYCNQKPKSGLGVVVLSFQYNNLVSDLKSITRTKLKSRLMAGKTYCLKINAVFAERSPSYITDGLQLYFDNGGLDTMISIRNDSSSYYPQVVPQLSLTQVLTDTINWNLLMGSFVAYGNEEYLTIGNFKSDSSTTKIVINSSTLNDPGSALLIDDVSVYPIDLTNWLPPTFNYVLGDSALIGLPNYETPDAKWYTYNMQLIDSGSQIKVLPPASGTKYICGIDMCNTMVFDTVTVVGIPLGINNPLFQQWELRVYPNPARDVISVEGGFRDVEKLKIYNYLGQEMECKQLKINNSKFIIETAGLPRGLYYVKCKTQVGKVVLE
jgi:hypothetical protein